MGFLKGYDNIAQARVTAALVLKIKLADFENLKLLIETEFPGTQIVFQRVSAGRLWIKEEEVPPNG